MHPSFGFFGRKFLGLVFGAAVLFAAGCHNNNLDSGYGIAWVTLSDSPGDFTSYTVTVDSVTLTRNDGAVVTAVATPEVVDFTQLTSFSELWASSPIPTGTYLSASITIDYTSAVIAVLVNGLPVQATVVNSAGTAVTTLAVNVTFDPNNPLVLTPSYATSHAERLAIDFHASTSSTVNFATSPPTVTANPYFTASIAPADTKLIRVRGPLINSSAALGTFSLEIRPFHDEVDDIGTLSIFNTPNTIYTIDGSVYQGSKGVDLISTLSAGITVIAAYTTLVPSLTPAGAGTAGTFYSNYVIAGESLESPITERLTGDVIARSGNTLTVRGATLSFNTGVFDYEVADSQVLVDSATNVTADGQSFANLTEASIGVGQHIEAIGVYTLPSSNIVTLDATGTNEGVVRLQSTQLFGQLVTGGPGALSLNLQAIDDWPIGDFDFAGTGTAAAQDAVPTSFTVATGATDTTALAAGTPLWINGFAPAFGSAPPDFNALPAAVIQEAAEPASLRVTWPAGTLTPFVSIGGSGVVLNLADHDPTSASLVVGAETIPMSALGSTVTIAPAPAVTTAAGVPPTFLTSFSLGSSAGGIAVFNDLTSYATAVTKALATPEFAQYLEARGTYDPATNVFTANSIDLVVIN